MKTSFMEGANSWKGPFIEVMQAERANVTANVLHPGCIDTNFGKGEFPFSFNKYVEGKTGFHASQISYSCRIIC
jgi:hypothetical protein